MVLKGKTILTTRSESQSKELSEKLTALGARVIAYPTIEILPIDDWTMVDEAIRGLNRYQWLVLTSGNAVDCFFERMKVLDATCNVPVAVIGKSTAKRVETFGIKPAIVPEDFRAEGLLARFPEDLSGSTILLPRAEVAREILPEELRRRGAKVDVVTVYRTIKPEMSATFTKIVSSETIDCVVFTSPSTVHNLAASVDGASLSCLLGDIPVAAIGPVTADAANALGLAVSILPKQASLDELVSAIAEYFKNR